MGIVSRAYNRFETIDNAIIAKRSSTDRLKDEINFYKNVCDEFSSYFPRHFSSHINNNGRDHSLYIEYYAYPNAYWIMNNEMLQKGVAHRLSNCLSVYLVKAERYTIDGLTLPLNEVTNMYHDKTLKYLNELRSEFDNLVEMLSYNELVINGKVCQVDKTIKDAITTVVNHRVGSKITFMHGDLCFSNILTGFYTQTPVIKLIDPRGRFGTLTGIMGDHYYDLAKLRHSTHGGYEHIINDNFIVKNVGGNRWELDIPTNEILKDVFEQELYNVYDHTIIQLIEGLIFIGMCSRHYDSERRQRAMYLNGIRILSKALDRY